jgi:hypothetical protein
MARYLGRQGVLRAPLLPVRWGRDTDLTISAVQGLDPWLQLLMPFGRTAG